MSVVCRNHARRTVIKSLVMSFWMSMVHPVQYNRLLESCTANSYLQSRNVILDVSGTSCSVRTALILNNYGDLVRHRYPRTVPWNDGGPCQWHKLFCRWYGLSQWTVPDVLINTVHCELCAISTAVITWILIDHAVNASVIVRYGPAQMMTASWSIAV